MDAYQYDASVPDNKHLATSQRVGRTLPFPNYNVISGCESMLDPSDVWQLSVSVIYIVVVHLHRMASVDIRGGKLVVITYELIMQLSHKYDLSA